MRVFVAVAVSVFDFVFVPVFAHPYPFSNLPSSNTRASRWVPAEHIENREMVARNAKGDG